MKVKSGDCLVWETEVPLANDTHNTSPKLFLEGCSCVLTIDVDEEDSDELRQYTYKLEIDFDDEVTHLKDCRVTTCLEGRSGEEILGQSTTISKKEENLLWEESSDTIRQFLPNFHPGGNAKFFITFGSGVAKNELSLKTAKDFGQDVKSVQTPLHLLDDRPCVRSLTGDLSKLLEGGSLPHDVQLKCGDHTFGAHRSILSARSQVFAKMLQSDMAEGRTGLVEVQDMDNDILGHFLRYLYTVSLPDLTTESAMGLYEAGDKYAVAELKRRCSDFLTEKLTPDNACRLLELADAHGDSQFKESVISYILDEKIPLQDKWDAFAGRHPTLAYPVLNRFYKMHISKVINSK